ncbi:hypothetical protein BRD17_09240 [Halobacteriales archaeon SW_7_68_16]|nr:MAG: hypothetical protein BRD17_09240 [Halobacteriales archaeon SW_7_68_16]
MSDDASIDDFLPDDDTGPDDGTRPVRDDADDPATITAVWSDGGVCPACGESAPRRYVEGDRAVCPACREW